MALAVACAILIWLVAALFVFGRRARNYSSLRGSISALGKRGARDEGLVSYGVFLPIGCGALLAAWRLHAMPSPLAQTAAGLACSIAIGYLVSAVCHLDPSSVGPPRHLHPTHVIHLIGAALEYGGAAVFLAWKAPALPGAWRGACLAGALVIAGGGCALAIGAFAPIRGALQRVLETFLFGLLVALAYGAS